MTEKTIKHTGVEFGVRSLKKFVRIIIADARGELRQMEFEGMMEIPTPIIEGNVVTNWTFDEIFEPMKGQVCDPQAEGVNIVFPIMEDDDVISMKTAKPLTFDEICDIFKKYHPTLKANRTK